MRSTERYIQSPNKYIGQYVRATTYDHQIWKVVAAHPQKDGAIFLGLESLDGSTLWHSDNEHATIVPGFNAPVDEPAMDPNTRRLVEDE